MPDTREAFDEFRREAALLHDLGKASALLGWDQDTYMPPGGAEGRGHVMATLSALHHERLTSPRMGELLAELEGSGLDPASPERAMVREARRAFDRATKLPRRLVEELARRSSSARQAWVRAREADDYALFEPELKAMLELKREEADAVGHGGRRYDALLDQYEPGTTAAELEALFAPLRTRQAELLAAIGASGVRPDATMLALDYPEAEQHAYASAVAARLGYDFERGRLDETIHPFAESMGLGDVRITTRYVRDDLANGLFSVLHEVGHALYEQGIDPAFARTPLAHGASLGLHESQSRLWENLVGRSLAFWEGAYPGLQAAFPAQLAGVPLERFHAAVNRVEPSLVRTEADEVSYNVHVLVRFELELALLEGDLDTRDLPGAWNERYREYLGVTPPSDLLGCLQDIHWSVGLIGYFPTYALGNLMSVQLYEAAQAALGDLDAQLRVGELAPLLGWLREHVHRHGSRYQPQELLERATGARLDAEPYLAYLRRKFGALYGLEP